MTQEFVTLPREVVERALEALSLALSDVDWRKDSPTQPVIHKAYNATRSALDQPQANQPAMTPIAQRKLDDLVASGYTISGYSIYHEQKHQHGFVTGAGLVGWWKPDGMEYPQPQGEQESVAVARVDDLEGGGRVRALAMNLSLDAPLYTDPQPKREPLTDDQIDAIAEKGPDGRKYGHWFARAIEAAHNIK